LIIDCKSAYYVELLKRVGSQRPELRLIFGPSVLTVCEVTERSVSSNLWRKVEQQSIAVLHTRQCHYSTGTTAIYRCTAHQTVPLWHRYNSNLSLYCTADSATMAPVQQQSIGVLHSRQCHCSTGTTAIYRSTAHQTVPL
jgi:hypothetical protein